MFISWTYVIFSSYVNQMSMQCNQYVPRHFVYYLVAWGLLLINYGHFLENTILRNLTCMIRNVQRCLRNVKLIFKRHFFNNLLHTVPYLDMRGESYFYHAEIYSRFFDIYNK